MKKKYIIKSQRETKYKPIPYVNPEKWTKKMDIAETGGLAEIENLLSQRMHSRTILRDIIGNPNTDAIGT